MGYEWFEYGEIAVHTTLNSFKDWLQGYLETSLNQTVLLRKFCSDDSRYLAYVVSKEFEVMAQIKYKTSEDIEYIFIANKQTPHVKQHITSLFQAIRGKWEIASLPHGFKNIIKDDILLKILESRWDEADKTFKAEAYLSTVILLGGILEGVLFYILENNYDYACQRSSDTRHKGKKIPISDKHRWGLEKLINIAHDCKWLSQVIKNYDVLLKEYRNLIHPKTHAEQYHNYNINRTTCKMLLAVVENSLDELSRI